jgi:photosystem II stability/assembly factor-like uncharacterized protein
MGSWKTFVFYALLCTIAGGCKFLGSDCGTDNPPESKSAVVLYTEDAGATWHRKYLTSARHLYGIAVTPTWETWLAAGTDNDERGIILKTSDNGDSWYRPDSLPYTLSPFFDIAGTVLPNTFIAVGMTGLICRTDDQGETWRIIDAGTTNILHGISMTGSLPAIIVGQGVILRSTDIGSTWSDVSGGLSGTLEDVAHTYSDTILAVGRQSSSGNGLFARSTNAGLDWTYIPYASPSLNGIAIAGIDTVVVVGKNGTIMRSDNCGNSWEPVVSPTTENLYEVAYHNGYWTAVGAKGTIIQSIDGGRTWQTANSGLTDRTITSLYPVTGFGGYAYHGFAVGKHPFDSGD